VDGRQVRLDRGILSEMKASWMEDRLHRLVRRIFGGMKERFGLSKEYTVG
jgi:hypothetical protein